MSSQQISPVKYALKYLKKYKLKLAAAIFWSILFVIIPMQVPILTGALIDGIHGKSVKLYGLVELNQTPEQILNLAVIGLVLVAAIYGVTAYFRTTAKAKISRHFVFELQKALIQKLEFLSLDIHAKYGSGELLNRTIVDTGSVRPFVEGTIIKACTNVVRITYPLLILFIMDPILAVMSSSILPVQFFLTRTLQKKLHKSSRHSRKNRSKLTTFVKESLDGIETIQTSNAERYSIEKISRQAEKLEAHQLHTQKYFGLMTGLAWSLTSLGLAITWWQGGLKVISGEMTIGNLIVFTGFVLFIYAPLRRFTEVMKDYHKSITAVENIQEILDTPSSIQESLDAVQLTLPHGKIELQNVSFSYAERKVLNNLNITIEKNSITAIVGKSGSGKSSLLKLITRLYDSSEGQILIDGQDIKKVAILSLRKAIAVVPQTPVIFNGTILENVRLARPEATDQEVIEACKSADALEFILKLDRGFNAVLGTGGTNLSGGQVQRVAIARALLKKPRILLLDEPSSALDTKSESAVIATLEHLKNNMTIILVGHHLKAISSADRLIVLDDGKVVQEGTHKELVSSQGVYSLLYSWEENKN